MRLCVYCIGLVVVLLSRAAVSREIVISNNGNDITGDGSVANPYKTITKGIQVSVHGDVMKLRGGTYSGTGNVNVNFATRAIVIRPYGDYWALENVTIDCGGSPNRAFVFDQGETSSSRIEYLTIKNGDVRTRQVNFVDDKHGGALKIASSPTIYNVTFENCQARSGGAIYISKSGPSLITPIIRNCRFLSNAASGGLDGGAITASINMAGTIDSSEFSNNWCVGNGGAICVLDAKPSGTLTIDNCVFWQNRAGTNGSAPGGALRVLSRTLVSKCTFFDNKATYGCGISASGDSGFLAIERSIIAFNDHSAVDIRLNSTATFQCNDFWKNTGGSISGTYDSLDVDANTIFEDPLFCDTAAKDFHISSYSPCDEDSSRCDLLIGRYNNTCTRCCNFAGDVDNSGDGPDISDESYLIAFLYLDGPWPPCLDEADVDGTPGVDMGDLSYLIAYLHFGGPAPTCP